MERQFHGSIFAKVMLFFPIIAKKEREKLDDLGFYSYFAT